MGGREVTVLPAEEAFKAPAKTGGGLAGGVLPAEAAFETGPVLDAGEALKPAPSYSTAMGLDLTKPIESPLIKDPAESFFGGVGSMIEGGKRALWQSRLEGIRQQMELGKSFPNDPKVQERQKELKVLEEEALKNLNDAKDLQDTYAAYDAVVARDDKGIVDEAQRSMVRSAPGLVGALATFMVTKSPGAAAVVGGTAGGEQVFVDSYKEAADKGMPTSAALAYATDNALLESAGDLLGLKAIMKPAQKVLGKLVTAVGVNSGEEAAVEFGQAVNEYIKLNPDITLGEVLKRMQVAALAGGATAAVASPVASALERGQTALAERGLEAKLFRDLEQSTNTRLKTPEQLAIEAQMPAPAQQFGQTPVVQPGMTATPLDETMQTRVRPEGFMDGTAAPAAGAFTPTPSGVYGEAWSGPPPIYKWTTPATQQLANLTLKDPEAAATWVLRNFQRFEGFGLKQLFESPAFVQVPQEQKDAVLSAIEGAMERQGAATREELKGVTDKLQALEQKMASLPPASSIPLSPQEQNDLNVLSVFARDSKRQRTPQQMYAEFYQRVVDGAQLSPATLRILLDYTGGRLVAPKNILTEEAAKIVEGARQRLQILQGRQNDGTLIPDSMHIGDRGGAFPFSNPVTISAFPGTPNVVLSNVWTAGAARAEPLLTVDSSTASGLTVVGMGEEFNRGNYGLGEYELGDFAKKVAAVLEGWRKKLPLGDMDLVVEFKRRTGTKLGDALRLPSGGVHVRIFLEDEKIKNLTPKRIQNLFSVLAHEIGHALGPVLLERSPPAVRSAVVEDYKRQLRLAATRSMDEAKLLLGGGWSWEASGLQTMDQILMEELLREGKLSYGSHQMGGYRASFDEYLAHQLEKALRDNFKGMQNPLKVFYKGLASLLRNLYVEAKRAVQQLAGADAFTETYRDFLQYHLDDAKARGLQERLDAMKLVLDRITGQDLPPDLVPKIELVDEKDVGGAVGGIPQEPPRMTMHGAVPGDVKEGADKIGFIKEWFGTLLGLARDNPHIKELSDPQGTYFNGRIVHGYLQYTEQYAQERLRWLSMADERLREFRQLPSDQRDIVGEVLLEQTVSGKFMTPEELFNRGVSEDGGRFIAGVREDFAAFLEGFKQSSLDRIRRMSSNNPNVDKLLQQKAEEFDKLLAVPYFPMSRFGDYLLIVKDSEGKTKSVSSFYTQIEAKLAAVKAKGGLKSGETLKLDKVRETQRAFIGMPPQLIQALRGELGLTEEQQRDLDDLLKRWAPEEAFAKHLIKRKKTAGFSHDIQRAYASYFFNAAGHLARAKYRDDLAESVSRLHASATAMTEDSVKRREIANYASRHLDELLNPAEDWARFRGMVAVALLGGVLRSAFVNFTQIPAFAYPHLAAHYGDLRATKELLRALKDAPKAFRASRQLKSWEEVALTKFSQGIELSPKEARFVESWTGLSAEEHLALERAAREGVTNQSLAMEVAALSQGNLISRIQGARRVGFYGRQLAWALMLPFELVEKLNRRSVLLAGYRLAKAEGVDEETAYQAAKAAVQQTQFEHSKWNRPQITRGRKGAALVFMQYQFNALSFLTGGDAGWWRAWAMLLLMGGVTGLPFAGNLMDFLSWLLSSKNKKVDVEREVKHAAKELFGDVMGTVLTLGTSRYGFGLLPMADLSGSVSMARPLPMTELLNDSGRATENLSRGLADLGGASASLVLRMYRGLFDSSLPAWKRAELAMPLSAGQQAMQALRWYREGAEKTSAGATILRFDPNDAWQAAEIAGRGLAGLTPRSLNEGAPGRGPGREDYYARNEMVRFYTLRRQMLLQQLAATVKERDRAAQTEVLREIRDYNREVPVTSMRLSGDQIRLSLKARLKGVEAETRGGTTRGEREIQQGIDRGKF